jgi:YfiR/HmsC-like
MVVLNRHLRWDRGAGCKGGRALACRGPRKWVTCVLVASAVSASLAVGQSPTEYQVKAAYLYNFAKFVEWPSSSFASPTVAMQICILGQNPFGSELQKITNGKLVNGHAFAIRYARSAQEVRGCHILFIASSEGAHIKRTLEELRGSNVLTVGDSPGFLEEGGMINCVLEDDRVQFQVNHKAINEAGLYVSSRLLSVAKLVIE